jgi:hypothetical protein
MKSFKQIVIFTSVVLSLLATSQVNAAGVGNNIVVRLAGVDGVVGEPAKGYGGNELFAEFGLTPPPEDVEDVQPLCFDLDLIDAKTGNVIGTASDCLSVIKSSVSDNGIMLTGTTFFFFPGGTLVSQGKTTIQPVLHGSVDFTHITGAVPSPGDESVVYGDGKFKNASGPVRLSGAVNLSKLDSDGKITFDCVFIINI